MTQLTAITSERFAHQAWKRSTGYAFAAQANILPVTAAELAQVVPAMPLTFVHTGDAFQLAAIAALQPGANYFVAPDGRWLGEYVPATLSAYPLPPGQAARPRGQRSLHRREQRPGSGCRAG